MNKLRILIIIGVVLVAFALVGASLAAGYYSRQAALPDDVPSSISINNQSSQQVSSSQAWEQVPAQYPNQEFPQNTTHPYQPVLPKPRAVDPVSYDEIRQGIQPQSPQGDPGIWDSQWVGFAQILEDSGTLYLWYTGFSAGWGSHGIGLATSTDGITWEKYANTPFITPGSQPDVLQIGPADYRMYYSIWDNNSIYVATSPDGLTWTPLPDPVFIPTGVDGDWDRDAVYDPMVIYDGATYYLYYEGTNELNGVSAIGLATSVDGYSWTRSPSNPVLTIGAPGEWDDITIYMPMVLFDGADWQMWYTGIHADTPSAIGYATSSDGITWTKSGSNPVFIADPNGWDRDGPMAPWITYEDSTYKMWYSASRQIGYATSTDGIDWTRLDQPVLKPSSMLTDVRVNYAHDWVEFNTVPSVPVTVTLKDSNGDDKASVIGLSDYSGFFNSGEWPWNGDTNIRSGDRVFIEAEGLAAEIDPIGEIAAAIYLDTDIVSGTIHAPWFDTVNMYCELWSGQGGSVDIGEVDGDGGTFTCNYGEQGIDLGPGSSVAIFYTEPDGDNVLNVIDAPWMRVNYAHDWVGGNYAIGHTFSLTILDHEGAVKATAEAQSEEGRGWGGDGFETRWEDWTPQGIDIVPGDTAIFESDDGFYDEIQVGDIQGAIDIDQDVISGPIYTEWFTDDLYVECHPWGSPPGVNGRNSTAGPDGDPPYTCDWSGEWDILPGQEVAVMYFEPDSNDRIISVFRDPAADMWIRKTPEGSAQVLPGGPVIFNIEYSNDGDAAAEYFIITDTLPVSTSYVADSSGVLATVGDGWVSWEFGPIEPKASGRFKVVLTNTAPAGTTLDNWVGIYTPYDFNDMNDQSNAQAYVGEGNYNLYVWKNPNPGDPTPGDTFIYNIDYGNQDAFASPEVVLTETLPVSTSLEYFYSMNQYNLWEQVSYENGVLVLRVPTIPGYWGDTLRLVLRVDENASYDTNLVNTVEVTATGDIDPWNDWFMNDSAWVSAPRLDARINLGIPWNRIYPGGELVYPINFYNDGNTTFDAVITDTLPAGLSYVSSAAWMHGINFPFEPVYVDDQVVVWNYGSLPPGEWIDVDLRLAVDPAYQPGTPAVNCIEIYGGELESSPFNNAACVETVIQDVGPNLRLVKNYQWNWEGQIQYSLDVQNIGSEAFDNFFITDTLPVSTSYGGKWWSWGTWITMTENTADNQLIFWVDWMNPGDTAGINYLADIDDEFIGQLGRTYTNQAVAPIPGDVNPSDNTVETTAFTGADVYIEKWLSGGDLLPGEVITFTVEFGNRNQWPWDGDHNWGSHITDTLPAEMTFLYATGPWNANAIWDPESMVDGVIRWGWGPMWAQNIWRYDIVVQLADDLEDGTVLTNRIEAYGDNPDDYDFDWSNNQFECTVIIDLTPFDLFLPIVTR